MSFQDVKQIIDNNIFTNSQNLVTAQMANDAVTAVLNEAASQIGDINYLLIGGNLVDAINQALTSNNPIAFPFVVHTGINNPNLTPPSIYGVGDFYVENGYVVYQYSGGQWVQVQDMGNFVPTNTIRGRVDVGDGPPSNLTVDQVKTMLCQLELGNEAYNAFRGDYGYKTYIAVEDAEATNYSNILLNNLNF